MTASAPLAAFARRVYGLRWTVLPPTTAIAMFALLAGAVIAAPREAVEGEVQRLMYIHVPSAVMTYLAFGITFVASLIVLWRRDMRWDAAARASATVGVIFTGITLATGALWGKPIWGVYWAWDARLTSTLVLFLIFGAYLLVRAVAGPNDEQVARYAAVFAIIGSLDIPLIHMSVRWWRTLHPQPIVFRPVDGPALPAEMVYVLLMGFLAIFLLVLWLTSLYTDAERLAQRTHALRARVDRGDRV